MQKLPYPLEQRFPVDVVRLIYSYLPPNPVRKYTFPTSPSLQRELYRIQLLHLRGKSTMYMKTLDEFVLD